MMFINQALENGLKVFYLSSSLSGSLQILTGRDNAVKTLPCVICRAGRATEEVIGTGFWKVETSIIVKQSAADSEVSSSLADDVFVKFADSGSTVGNYSNNLSVIDVILGGIEVTQEDDAWVHTLSSDVYCVNNN